MQAEQPGAAKANPTIGHILSRTSATRLAEPAPPNEIIEAALRCGLAAPDHGRLRPWQFLVIRGPAREGLGELFRDALARRDPNASPRLLANEAEKATRAPLILVVGVKVQSQAKIPLIEQVMAGAAAAQNIMLAFHAAGVGCMWKTGAAAYDAHVKAGLGLGADDHLAAFLYVGTRAADPVPRSHVPMQDHVFEWHGPKIA